ncbi:MAG: DEAD/DEAH box helicase family protein [Alkalimonas sp.]|nr:DEAD/DEAH box helicase family protein [Alkalimonas sp.]
MAGVAKAPKARKAKVGQSLAFSDKLVLNQWILSLLGVDPLAEYKKGNRVVRPFHVLAKTLRDCPEGVSEDNLHHFYQQMKIHWQPQASISPGALLQYEQNIVDHTEWLNQGRERPIVWKYYQWLSLLFAEIYLHQYFSDRDSLLEKLNAYVARFNAHWRAQHFATGITPYTVDELNKLCLQNATGSGKTLLMHVNYRQFAHYAEEHGQHDMVTRTLLITPNEGLSSQHEQEMKLSGIEVGRLVMDNNDMFSSQHGHLTRIDFIEITKLGEKDGDRTIATRNLGDQNLILVDEGHRGMGKSEEEGWYRQRARLTEKGFAFEYSATFKEAVKAANNARIEETYAKQVLFDYSYRYFYEDGYGKDYRIFNIPKSQADHEFLYLTACMLGFYQQLRLYKERKANYSAYNLEKPLWVFVGGSVSKAVRSKKLKGKAVEVVDETASDIVQVLGFIARFLAKPQQAMRAIEILLSKAGKETGLVDGAGNDIFHGAFIFLRNRLQAGETAADIHTDILHTLFNNRAGGQLQLLRLKGDSGELLLRAGNSEQHFGLINVGDALGLARHVEEESDKGRFPPITIDDSDFHAAQFESVKESSSPINILMGAKKFVEGWDCWRVSTLALMRVGRSEGSQIIQLFGRGVRLKGYDWTLKRSRAATPVSQPEYIHYIETLNVFGVQADFMEKFRDFLKEEGLPGNDSKQVFQIPMNLTYDFGHKLKVIRPKLKDGTGREYNFNRDGAMPLFGGVPDYLTKNRVEVDWYPKIQAIVAKEIKPGAGALTNPNKTWFGDEHIAFLDTKQLFFELEQYKARENLYSLIILPQAISGLLKNPSWYLLSVPANLMALDSYANVRVWNQIALELLKRYCKKYFLYAADAFIRPRLEVRELGPADKNLPEPDEQYQLTVDASEKQLINDIEILQAEIEKEIKAKPKPKRRLIEAGQLKACILGNHLFQPLLFAEKGSPITIAPVSLNDSEKNFVVDLMEWLDANEKDLQAAGTSLYLLRNKSRGSGIGFFEAGNFYPDFILWLVTGDQQKVVFIEPHGISHEGREHPKVKFHKTIKDVESRLGGKNITLESFIVTPTRFMAVQDRGLTIDEWAAIHVLFMNEGQQDYVDRLFKRLL